MWDVLERVLEREEYGAFLYRNGGWAGFEYLSRFGREQNNISEEILRFEILRYLFMTKISLNNYYFYEVGF